MGLFSAKKPKRDVDATFDWEQGVIHSTFEGERSRIPLPRDTQDRLSLMYQFMKVTGRQGTVRVPMSNGRKVDIYTYRLVNEERLVTPAGEFDTLPPGWPVNSSFAMNCATSK